MLHNAVSEKFWWLAGSLLLGMLCVCTTPAVGGQYLDSAHGNSNYGVNRFSIDEKYAGYATGNCAHCHEVHASLEGTEPSPTGGPAPHNTFADSFNTNRTQNFYLETDNFCFYCHSDSPGPQVRNQDYSSTFGGATSGSGPQSILEAFNQVSYHNLYDIWKFLDTSPVYAAWFAKHENPCSACHNSHLAKRNWDPAQQGFPLLSAISIPGISDKLWGETEVMSTYFIYEAPYAYFGVTREPAGGNDQNGANTPDYVGFCTSCHNPDNTIWSTTLSRELKKLNWTQTGPNKDTHGPHPRNGTDIFREPYAATAAQNSNFFLSCLDCHEPHGSENVMLLRRRINGENLEGTIDTTDTMSYVCKRCHQDDLAAAAGTGQADRWQYVHHLAPTAPYPQMMCGSCHGSSGGSTGGGMGGGMGGEPIGCGNCHGHGMDDSWAGANKTGLKTF
jgi:hypothetical protein